MSDNMSDKANEIRKAACENCTIWGWCRPFGRPDCEEVTELINNEKEKELARELAIERGILKEGEGL